MKTNGLRLLAGAMGGLGALAVPGAAGAIIGGQPASEAVQAATVLVGHRQGLCSGTLIAPRIVLTAAHCTGFGGLSVVSYGSGSRTSVGVSQVVVHPRYRAEDWARRRASVDIALLFTDAPVAGRSVRVSSGGVAGAGSRMTVAGFGPVAEFDRASLGRLRQGELTVTGNPGSLQVRLTGAGRGACVGDSGGPAYRQEAGGLAVAGVISWTTGPGNAQCGELTGTVPVAPHRGWIEEQIRRLGGS